jgi:hypothetical protein
MDMDNTSSSASSAVPNTRSSDSFLVVSPNEPSEPSTRSTAPPVQLYAKFKIGEAIFGDEPVKPLTYFPITCELVPVRGDIAVSQSVPLHFRSVPQLGISTARVRFESAITTVERRYSELVTYRQLLVTIYPGLTIPALPEKNQMDNLQTYWQNKSGLKQQQRNIGRFLRGIAAMPEIMLFTEFTQPMFQLPRETFMVQTDRMRELLRALKSRTASIEQHRPARQASASASAVGALAAESTRVVRSLVTALGSWYSKATQTSATQSLQARIDDLYLRSSEVAYWNALEQQLTERKNALLISADTFLAFLAQHAQVSQAIADVGEAMEGFSAVVSEAVPELPQYSPAVPETRAVRHAAEMTQSIANSHVSECDKWYTAVYEQIAGEVADIDAMIDSMDFVRCLFRQRYEAEIETSSSNRSDVISNALLTHERLAQDVRYRCMPAYRRRMQQTCKSLAAIALQFAHKEEEQAGKCAFHRMMLGEDYMSF